MTTAQHSGAALPGPPPPGQSYMDRRPQGKRYPACHQPELLLEPRMSWASATRTAPNWASTTRTAAHRCYYHPPGQLEPGQFRSRRPGLETQRSPADL